MRQSLKVTKNANNSDQTIQLILIHELRNSYSKHDQFRARTVLLRILKNQDLQLTSQFDLKEVPIRIKTSTRKDFES